jgi:hypothetical protein
MNEVVTKDGEVLDLPEGYGSSGSLAVQLVAAEVNQQITTARAYPRSIDRSMKNIKSLATLDEQSAKECVYALPRGNKPIKGPSIRLAEIIATQWGNCRIGARVVHVDRVEKFVEAEGIFHDLETNSATTARVRRRLSDKNGRLLNDDMIVVTGNAACSIAKRNAILSGVPKGVWRNAYDAVERVLAGDIKTIAVKRAETMKLFAAFGVKPAMIFEALEIGGEADINADNLIMLYGMYEALKSGEETVETMFVAKKPDGPAPPRPDPKDFKKEQSQPQQNQPTGPQSGDAGEASPAGSPQGKAAAGDATTSDEPDEIWNAGWFARLEGTPLMSPPEGYTADEIARWKNGWNACDLDQKSKGK